MYLTLDLWDDIFDILTIRDKRMWILTCEMMQTYFVDKLEIAKKEFQETVDNTGFLGWWKFVHFDKLQRFTIESLHCGYMPPKNYLIEENYVLHRCPILYYNLAERGDIDLLKQMMAFVHTSGLSHMVNGIWNDICCGAMYGGHIAIYDWADENAIIGTIDYQILVVFAVKGGQLNMLKLMYYQIDEFDVEMRIGDDNFNLFELAARHGHLHIIEFLIASGFPCDYHMCFSRAAMGPTTNVLNVIKETLPGRIKVIEWAAKNDIDKSIACDYLAGMEDLTLFKWALDQGYKYDDYVCYFAAYNNRFDNLKQCYTDGHKLDNRSFLGAIRTGNIEMLEWLRNKMPDYQLNESLCTEAANSKHLEVIKWLRKLNCPWDNKMLEFCHNDIDILQYGLENGLETNNLVCRMAIDHEDVNILKLLRRYHTWTKDLDDYIVNSKHKGMIEWANSKHKGTME